MVCELFALGVARTDPKDRLFEAEVDDSDMDCLRIVFLVEMFCWPVFRGPNVFMLLLLGPELARSPRPFFVIDFCRVRRAETLELSM